MNRLLVLAMLLLVSFSGCADSEPVSTPERTPLLQYGGIQGQVLDDEQLPIANVTLTLVEVQLVAATGPDGGFAFENVLVGAYTLAASHALYNETTVAVSVVADESTRLNLTLVQKPEFRAFHSTRILEGSFECGAEGPIVTGPCWILVEGVSCRVSCVSDPAFKSNYQFHFDILERWETVVAELVWTAGANAFDGMRLYIENANTSIQGEHGTAVSKVHGNQQPLSTRIDRGQPAKGYETYEGTQTPAFIPDEASRQQVRVFPKGKAYEYTGQVCHNGQCFLGVGAGLNVRFTLYLSVFYNEAAPTDFSAVPKA